MVLSWWYFGINSLRIMGLCVAFSVLLDVLANWTIKTKDPTSNWTSVSFGIMLAFFMPYNATWWMILVACLVMIVIGKKIFGGYGAYPVHPVMLSFAIMLVSWPERFDYTAAQISIDLGVTMVEPMQLIKTIGSTGEGYFDLAAMLMGKHVAGIGNGLVICLLLGGIFLLLTRQITWHIPISFLGGVIVMALIVNATGAYASASPAFHLLKGSAIFGAFFIATESTTSPVNRIPMLIYGFLGGLILVLFRTFSFYHLGLPFAILMINLFFPLIDKITPKVYGVEVVEHAQ